MLYFFAATGSNPTVYFVARDSNGNAITGLTSASAGASCYYVRPLGTPVQVTLSDLASPDAVHSDGGMIEVEATNMPGLYRLDLPDAVISSGEGFAIVTVDFDAIERLMGLLHIDPQPSVIEGAVLSDAGNSVTQFKVDVDLGADQLNDAFLLFRGNTTAALAGQVKKVTDVDGTNDIVTVAAPGYSVVPQPGDEFVVVNR